MLLSWHGDFPAMMDCVLKLSVRISSSSLSCQILVDSNENITYNLQVIIFLKSLLSS